MCACHDHHETITDEQDRWNHRGRAGVRFAILSDIHENYHNLYLCIEDMRKQEIDQVLFLGDFMNAGIARMLATAGFPVFAIYGNNDGDKLAIYRESVKRDSTMQVHPRTYAEFSRDGYRFFLTHHDDLVETAVFSGRYDAVCFGHTHRRSVEERNGCIVVNPGELSAHKYGMPTYAILDSMQKNCILVELEGGVTVRTEAVALQYHKLGFDEHFGFTKPREGSTGA